MTVFNSSPTQIFHTYILTRWEKEAAATNARAGQLEEQVIIIIIIKMIIIIIIAIIIITRPWPAFGRQGLVGSSGGYTYHRYTSHASPRACGARLGRKVSRNGRNVISPIYTHFLKVS